MYVLWSAIEEEFWYGAWRPAPWTSPNMLVMVSPPEPAVVEPVWPLVDDWLAAIVELVVVPVEGLGEPIEKNAMAATPTRTRTMTMAAKLLPMPALP